MASETGKSGNGGKPRRRGKHPADAWAAELREWRGFALAREPAGESSLRTLLESYELFAASEGYPAVPEVAFVRYLENLGLDRTGTMFFGVRVLSAIPALRLLTRLELYGFRFAVHEGELAWRGPEVFSDLERRVIVRHRSDLAVALRAIEQRRAIMRGATAPDHASPWPPSTRRAA